MNMKKIVAAAVASVMAVSTMAIAASADVTASIPFLDDGNGNWQLMIAGDAAVEEAADLDVTQIAAFDLVLTFDDNGGEAWAGGAIVLQSDSLGWSAEQWENAVGNNKVYEGVESGKAIHVSLGDKKFVAEDTYAAVTFQNYGIDVNIDMITFYDEAGTVLLTIGTAPEAPSTGDETTADDTQEPATGDETPKDPVNTGIEGVAVVAGLAILATSAIVIAKKRK